MAIGTVRTVHTFWFTFPFYARPPLSRGPLPLLPTHARQPRRDDAQDAVHVHRRLRSGALTLDRTLGEIVVPQRHEVTLDLPAELHRRPMVLGDEEDLP